VLIFLHLFRLERSYLCSSNKLQQVNTIKAVLDYR